MGLIFGIVLVVLGELVKVINLFNGIICIVVVDLIGCYVVINLLVGIYSVLLIKDGVVIFISDKVVVSVGGGMEVLFVNF